MAGFQTRFVIARRAPRRGDPAGLLRRGATPLLAMTGLKTRPSVHQRFSQAASFPPMSSSSEFNIDHVAKLARLALTPEEKSVFSEQLGHVLHHIAELSKVDVTGVEPTAHAFSVSNVWQEDEARAGLTLDQALRNAPARRDNMIVVPKVVE
jgi:aspartyl-tRNA(Asn)/glutamyl-tRNA(Gln) amidotransferase subunit C